MERSVFQSAFKKEINDYLDFKTASGFQEKSFYFALKCFDQFCTTQKITEKRFSKEIASLWVQKRSNEATTTHYSRINTIKHFLIYLSRNGYDVFVTRDIRFKGTDFQPHIYSDSEIERYFMAVDMYESDMNRKNPIQLPILFRILYCCGTRINETLGIRKKDVDLEAGIIKLFETKNNCERYIVMSAELSELFNQFADKSFYMLSEEGYIFTSANRKRISGDVIYEIHRKLLKKAGIPYIGDNCGPRIHDWRHTFAVRSFKQMIDKGYDMYVALPILSAYLGHKTIYATEKYVRLTCTMFSYIEEKFKPQLNRIFGEVQDT